MKQSKVIQLQSKERKTTMRLVWGFGFLYWKEQQVAKQLSINTHNILFLCCKIQITVMKFIYNQRLK